MAHSFGEGCNRIPETDPQQLYSIVDDIKIKVRLLTFSVSSKILLSLSLSRSLSSLCLLSLSLSFFAIGSPPSPLLPLLLQHGYVTLNESDDIAHCQKHLSVMNAITMAPNTSLLTRLPSELSHQVSLFAFPREVVLLPPLPALISPQQQHLVKYRLPDGKHLFLGEERFGLTEPLFHPPGFAGLISASPNLMASPLHKGLANVITQCISAADPDLHQDLCKNILLSGSFFSLPSLLSCFPSLPSPHSSFVFQIYFRAHHTVSGFSDKTDG